MSTPNPLVPQGTNPNAPRVKSNIKIAVVTILAIHLVLFGGLLLQGCKRDNQKAAIEPTNALPTFDPTAFANNQPATGAQPAQPPTAIPDPALPAPGAVPVNTLAPTPIPVPQITGAPVAPSEPQATPQPAAQPAGNPGEYVVKKGDYFEKIAKENNTTVKALTAANPGVDSRKLKINQKLVLPPPSATPAPTATAAAVETASPGFDSYTVKSGDSLIRIASQHKTTVKALRAANSLKTDTIRVGQKLKIPVKIAAEAPPAVLPQPTTASTQSL